MKKIISFETQKMLNRIVDWDFNPEPYQVGYLEYKPGMLTLRPISLVVNDISMQLLENIIAKNKNYGIDVLNNDSYPIFDGDSGLMLCGNRNVAHALVSSGIQLAEKTREYPVYYSLST